MTIKEKKEKILKDNKILKIFYHLKNTYELTKEDLVFLDKIYNDELSLEENSELFTYFYEGRNI